MENTKICVVGLGYVGLPLACLFSQKYEVYGYERKPEKIEELKKGNDRTGEVVGSLADYKINYSSDPVIIKKCNFIIVAVPTPIDKNKRPDLTMVEGASKTVGQNLTKGAIVVYESTVYPGCTEEVCVPILEKESGLRLNLDFFVGYSPERVSPGDKEHTLEKIVKVVSGSTPQTLDKISEIYSSVITAGVHKVSNLKTAEATKILENVQRDLNIALMNEISIIFEKMNIDTKEVAESAGTKWNFVKYYPGLVGGHCISVDPYYLTYKSAELGYHPQVILAGRDMNDYMPRHVAELVIKSLNSVGKVLKDSKVLILGLTYKENVPDLRNSKAKELIKVLQSYQLTVFGHEPLVRNNYLEKEFDITNSELNDLPLIDAVIIFSPHQQFKEITLNQLKAKMNSNPIIFDLKRFYSKKEAEEMGFIYKCL
ncbi:nucleotide sugar dehydrogenase [Patescibacteria group bacterium]|nr:nucleotide sugar dehydrogenase [Patescibacteria group bacterium]